MEEEKESEEEPSPPAKEWRKWAVLGAIALSAILIVAGFAYLLIASARNAERYEDLSDQLDDLSAQLAALDDRLEEVEVNHSYSYAHMESLIVSLRENITALQTSVGDIENQVIQLQSRIDGLENRIEQLETAGPSLIGISIGISPDGTNWTLTVVSVPSEQEVATTYLTIFDTGGSPTPTCNRVSLSSLSYSTNRANYTGTDVQIKPGDRILLNRSTYQECYTFEISDNTGTLAIGVLPQPNWGVPRYMRVGLDVSTDGTNWIIFVISVPSEQEASSTYLTIYDPAGLPTSTCYSMALSELNYTTNGAVYIGSGPYIEPGDRILISTDMYDTGYSFDICDASGILAMGVFAV